MVSPVESALGLPYFTHAGGDLRENHVGQPVRLVGWMFRRRDHGGVAFVDLRGPSGLVQLVFRPESCGAELVEKITHTGLESVIQVEGTVIARGEGLANPNLPTGAIEIDVKKADVLGLAEPLPYALEDHTIPEELRLTYRFLDLRRDDVRATILLRNAVVKSLRERMWAKGFNEFQTPILTASSPEGARDFLVPSRIHPGKFYALPQAPQQFKQLLMVSGFDKYFQIAPCFRDEDARADRCPTDFYQLDLEMAFPTQDGIFALVEDVLGGVFAEFKDWNGNGRNAGGRAVQTTPWTRIPYDEAMAKYASDKPDLRCPLVIEDVSGLWGGFKVFEDIVAKGGFVRAIKAPAAAQPRSWFDDVGKWAMGEYGAPAAPGYISWKDGEAKGPLLKFLTPENLQKLTDQMKPVDGDVVFFIAGAKTSATYKLLSALRVRLGNDLNVSEKGVFRFAWIVDFPMFEKDDATGKIDFSHNPFSMPQGGMAALDGDPLDVKAFQYDLVCNGYELISGGIRNHLPEVMLRAFEIAGRPADEVKDKFRGLWKAFHLGTPPHGGCAAGLERVVMLLAESNLVREVVAFPMTQRGEDLLMGAPSVVSENQLKELHIKAR
ncbi:MAG TPA: aspartate--tRNA ligase [Alphaproteobacteria bacterium]|nr:aspartate--tRNA ligase [Alphaproteobacteria bacterium]